MHARLPVAFLAGLAALAAPAEAVRNSSWMGTSTAKLKFSILDAVVKSNRKGKASDRILDALLVGLDTSFVQAPGSGPALRGGVTEVDSRTCLTSGAGFEPQLEGFVVDRILPALSEEAASEVQFASIGLEGVFKLNRAQTKVKGKHTITFEGTLLGGVEADRTVVGTIQSKYKGVLGDGGPVLKAR